MGSFCFWVVGRADCGGTYNASLPRTNCTNNNGAGGKVTGSLLPACKYVIPKLTALGIRSELWLGEDDSLASARYLFSHARETAADLLAVAAATPGLAGFNIDLETWLGTTADAEDYVAFLTTVTSTLASAPSGPIRFSADVSCTRDVAVAPPILGNCKTLSAATVGRLMNMRTYNAPDYDSWYEEALVPALEVPRDILGVGLGCWIDSRTNGTWNVLAESARDRVCLLMNRSVEEIDMFLIKQGQPTPAANFPEPFWIAPLQRFMAGGGCVARVPKAIICPNATVGPADSWTPGGDPGCCTSSSRRASNATCDEACAQRECAAANMVWRPENYSVHPFECCHGNGSRGRLKALSPLPLL